MADLVTVFGGDGFVGRYVVQALLKSGARVRVASRNPKRGWFLKAQANLGQIAYVPADITRAETLTSAVAGADTVINLVGILKGKFDLVHRDGARNVAQAAAAAGVKTMIQMSAIGADANSASAYGRSKGEGDQAVLAAFPEAIIMRPSIIFGTEDAFVNRFAQLIKLLPIVPVIGGATKFQPVYVGDIAKAVLQITQSPATHIGKVLEFGGPQTLSMEGLNNWIAKKIGANKVFIPVPSQIAAAMARMTGWAPGAPITWDQWLMLQSDNVVSGADGFAALGIHPTPLDAIAEDWLVIYRKHGRFGTKSS
jgi:uncharacterized protein YbjT (DUF2867 family)